SAPRDRSRAARRAGSVQRAAARGRPGQRPAPGLGGPAHAGGRAGGPVPGGAPGGGRDGGPNGGRSGRAGAAAPRGGARTLMGGRIVPPRHATLVSALETAARSRWGLSFLDSQEREPSLSFAEMYQRARTAAGGLREMGVARGDRVAIILPT